MGQLSWPPASDDHTPADGLSYNLRARTSPGASDVVDPMTNTTVLTQPNGYRRIVSFGNAEADNTATIGGWGIYHTYYLSVQAIDNSWQGDPFAAEGSFVAGVPITNTPTVTVAATTTPYPTNTPYATSTPYSTNTAGPSNTPYPAYTAGPLSTPYPTYTPPATHTPTATATNTATLTRTSTAAPTNKHAPTETPGGPTDTPTPPVSPTPYLSTRPIQAIRLIQLIPCRLAVRQQQPTPLVALPPRPRTHQRQAALRSQCTHPAAPQIHQDRPPLRPPTARGRNRQRVLHCHPLPQLS